MKKVIIGILIIIPIIIMLVVTAVSVVVSTTAYIGVESITFDTNYSEVHLGQSLYNLNDYISVTVLPERATDRSYAWTIDNITCLDEEYLDAYNYSLEHKEAKQIQPAVLLVDKDGNQIETSETGDFVINTYCSFVVTARAETMTARCTVYVVSDTLEDVKVYGASSVKENESILLNYQITPADANIIKTEWISSNEEVATVNGNGVVSGIKAGETTIIARAYTSESVYVESDEYAVSVTKNITLLGNKIYTHTRTLPLSKLGVGEEDILSKVNCDINGDNLVINEDKQEARIDTSVGTCIIYVIDDGAIAIKDAEIYQYGEGDFVLSSNGILQLQAVWQSELKDGTPDVIWSIDDTNIAKIYGDGTLIGSGEGIVKVTARCGEYIASVSINVRQKISIVILDKTAEEFSEVGLALEYVIASKKYDNFNKDDAEHSVVANYIDINLVRPRSYDNATFYDSFNFELLESDGSVSNKGYFEKNRLYFIDANITEKTALTIKVSAKYTDNIKFSTDSVVIKVVNGIKVDDYYSLKSALDACESVCLANNIVAFNGEVKVRYEAMLTCQKAYYGNNYMLSSVVESFYNNGTCLIRLGADNAIISNGIFRANEVGSEIKSESDSDGLLGSCIIASAGYDWKNSYDNVSNMPRNMRVEYCICENAGTAMRFLLAECTIEGCIIRNTSGTGVYVRTMINNETYDGMMYSYLTVKNCVMSNMVGMGFSFDYQYYGINGDEYRAQAMAEGRNTVFHQEGFLDIYNWQSVNTMKLLPDNVIGDDDTSKALAETLNSIIRTHMMDDDFTDYRYNLDRNDYFLLGAMSCGFVDKSCLTGTLQDTRIQIFNSTQIKGFQSLAADKPVYMFTYGKDVSDITPDATYVINKKLIQRLHGIGVEYSKETETSFSFI